MKRLVVLAAGLAIFLLIASLRTHASTNPLHLKLWLCVHYQERSAWNDPDPPYFGGLQMGWWFMRTYGGRLLAAKGTADRWTPLEQMWVAENAYRREHYSRAWLAGQWPPSRGVCF